MRDPWNDAELIRRFRAHSRISLPRAPLNSALCAIIADDPTLHSLLAHAPATQQTPVLLLAAIHDRVLREPDHPLADWYPNLSTLPRSPDDSALASTLTEFVHERGPAILDVLATRRVQTNEVGRCALFVPAFALVADEVGPLAHLDVGTSAGLTTLWPHFSYRYDDGDRVGEGTPLIRCHTRGRGPLPVAIPAVATTVGLDVDPLDPTDADDARWLQACCWPDQTDRFERLSAAIATAAEHPPTVVTGDALAQLDELVVRAAETGHPTITTSWVMNYLPPLDRRRFVDRLDELGSTLDLSWVIAESPAQTPELSHPTDLADEHITALTLITWRSGMRTALTLATCHPHGYWLHWR